MKTNIQKQGFFDRHQPTAFDYLAIIGLAINITVILWIVSHWLSS